MRACVHACMRQAAELDRGHTYASKFPGAPRRDLTRNRVKGPNFPGAPANGGKRPKKFRRYAPENSPGDPPLRIPGPPWLTLSVARALTDCQTEAPLSCPYYLPLDPNLRDVDRDVGSR